MTGNRRYEFDLAFGSHWHLGLNFRSWRVGVSWADEDAEIEVGPVSLLVWWGPC